MATLLKRKNEKTIFKSKKTGKEYHPNNYVLKFENGKEVLIKPVYNNDYSLLDAFSIYDNKDKQ